MLEKIQKFREYLDYIEEHYNNVQESWKLIKEKCGNEFRFMYDDFCFNTIEQEILTHDMSKLSAEEFTAYRQYFFPAEGEEKDRKAFNKAWENHKECNNHHWQNWTSDKDNPYADIYIPLMIADWHAMSIKFGGCARTYYEENKDKIILPEWAVDLMYKIFDKLYGTAE